jgi:hypothetical protein
MGHNSDRGAKSSRIHGFNRPTIFRPLTLVPIKQVLGLPLTNEINEFLAKPRRVSYH